MMMVVDPNVELAALCGELAKAECARLDECGLLGPPIDVALCMRRISEGQCDPIAGQFVKTVQRGQLSYDAIKGGTCRDTIMATSCDVGFGRNLFAEPACQAVVTGLSGEDGPCTINQACTGDLFCDASAARCPGVCRRLRGNNETCGGGEFCHTDFFCSAMTRRCRARVAITAPCEVSMQGNSCQNGGFCDGTQPGMGPVCVPVRGANTGCTSQFQCAQGLSCVDRFCSGGADGHRCRNDFDCDAPLACAGDGKCRPTLALDTDCTTGGAACREGLTCTSTMSMSKCRPRPVVGQSCANAVCYFGRCVNSTCEDPIPDGGECMTTNDCIPGLQCDMGLCAAPIACRL